MLIASAAGGGKKTAEIMQSYMNTVYTENRQYMDNRDDIMRKQLKELKKVEWKDILKISPIGIAMKEGRTSLSEGQTIEEFL